MIGVGRRPESLQAAVNCGAITRGTQDLAEGVARADLVVVCTPVDEIPGFVEQAALANRNGAIITDVGSTKAQIIAQVESARANQPRWPADVPFVGSHPLAGNDKRGAAFAVADLFAGRVVVITPTNQTEPAALAAIREFWTALGAKIVEMSPAEHDQALSVTSHLPHLVAAAIAGATPEGYVTLTAGGWLDTTRIAAGDPLLWRQIFLANRANVLTALAGFDDVLSELRRALIDGDGAALERLLTESKRIRDAVGN